MPTVYAPRAPSHDGSAAAIEPPPPDTEAPSPAAEARSPAAEAPSPAAEAPSPAAEATAPPPDTPIAEAKAPAQPEARSRAPRPATPSPVVRALLEGDAEERRKALSALYLELHVRNLAYTRAEARSAASARLTGLCVAVVSAIVGTSIFASIQSSPDSGWRIVAGGLSMVAVVLGATQTSLDFAGRSAQHRSAAEAYGKLQRQIFEWFVTGVVADLSTADIHSFLESVNSAEAGAPALSRKRFDQAQKDAEQEERDHPPF